MKSNNVEKDTAVSLVMRNLRQSSEQTQKATALQAVEDEEAALPPVIALGYRGEKCVYYSVCYKREFALKPGEHTKCNMLALAPQEELGKWLFPQLGDDDERPKDRMLISTMVTRLLDESGRHKGACSLETLRGSGAWQTDEGIIYNAGDACFLCPPGGSPRPCSNIRNGTRTTIYASRTPLPHPSTTPLSDEEGKALRRLFQARAWAKEWNADILVGWLVCAILGEALPLRPHVWVNAPSNTGKTELKKAIVGILGSLPVVLESAKTTEAACRGVLDNGTRPVIVDEADARGDDRRQVGNLLALVELARSSTCGGIIRKGTPEGGSKEYFMASPFLFFSICNVLSKEQDLNRFAVLEMRPLPPGEELKSLCQRWRDALSEVSGKDFTARLLTRVLQNGTRLVNLAKELVKYIREQAVAARTAEYTAYTMAGQWILTHSDDMTDEYRERAAKIAKELAIESREDNEAERALQRLLGHFLPNTASLTVEQTACLAAKNDKYAIEALRACKMKVACYNGDGAEKEEKYLFVLQSSNLVHAVYKDTEWNVGRDGVGKTLSRLPGVIYRKARVYTATPAQCIMIPSRYWKAQIE